MIFIVNEVKNFAANNILIKLLELVTYWDPCIIGGVHILESSEVLKRKKVFAASSSTGIVEFRDKGFILDLKYLFIIVDCFSGKFPPRFFLLWNEFVSLIFLGHHILFYLLFYCAWYWHDIDVCLFVLTMFIHNKSN